MRYTEQQLLEFLGTDKIAEKNGGIKGLFYVEATKVEDDWEIVEPKELDPALILPHPYNSLIYPRTDISVLQEQIKESNWVKPIVINRKRQAVSGNSRLACVRNLGWSSVPIEVCDFVDQEAELTRLILENSGRIKTTEERVREAEVLASAKEWLKTQQMARQRKILEQVRFSMESRKDARVSQLTGDLEEDWKLCQQWGINELSLKFSQAVRQDDLLAEATGMGSRENLRKATKVVQAIDLFEEIGRRVEAELLRGTLNHSVHSAILRLREIEGLEARYRYLGEDVSGSKGILSAGCLCLPGTIKLKDADSQAIVCEETGESFFVKWVDLELVGLGKNTPPKSPKPKSSPTPAPAVPVGKTPNIKSTSEPPPPAFAVGEKVWLTYREVGGIIERVQWSELHGRWLYHFRYLDSEKIDSLLEDHFEPWSEDHLEPWSDQDDFDVHSWVIARGVIGVVIDTEPIKVQWMGMGTAPAPRSDLEVGCEGLKSFDFNPFDPPKQALTGFKVGDVISSKADKECEERGTIVDRNEHGEFVIEWREFNGQLKDHQIHLAANCGFAMGDLVSFQWEGEMFTGQIASLFRCVADLTLPTYQRARVPYEWLNKMPKFCHQAVIRAIKDYVSTNAHPSGVLNLVGSFASHGDKQALKHLSEIYGRLNLPFAGGDSIYFMDVIQAFKSVLAEYEKPIDLLAIDDEQELVNALKGLSPKVIELSVLNLWKAAKALG